MFCQHLTLDEFRNYRRLDLELSPGVTVLQGDNASGKTSLLSALTAYLSPTSGTIEVLGERYGESDWRELRKHVGLVSSSIRQMSFTS